MTIDLKPFGGSHKRLPESTHKVSYWYIPGGADYHHAEATYAYFTSAEQAEAFATKYDMPPEMAMVVPLTTDTEKQHDQC